MYCTSRGLKAIAESPYSKNINKFNLEEMKSIDDACLYHIADSENLNFLIEINLRNPSRIKNFYRGAGYLLFHEALELQTS